MQFHEPDDSIKRMITFSSGVDDFLKGRSKKSIPRLDDDFDEFDEHSNISDKLQIYYCEIIGNNVDELRASKNKMTYEGFQSCLVSPQTKLDMRMHADQVSSLKYFGSHIETNKLPVKDLWEKESPKFSTTSEKAEESKLRPRTSREYLVKRSAFSQQKLSLTIRSKEKRWILVDTHSQLWSTFRMIWQTLATELKISNDLYNAKEMFKESIK